MLRRDGSHMSPWITVLDTGCTTGVFFWKHVSLSVGGFGPSLIQSSCAFWQPLNEKTQHGRL